MNNVTAKKRQDLLPSLGILVAAIMWGMFWIPVREVESAGIDAFWTSVLIFSVSAITFFPIVVFRWKIMVRGAGLILAFSGLMVVLGAGYQFPVPSDPDDWLALLSGLI